MRRRGLEMWKRVPYVNGCPIDFIPSRHLLALIRPYRTKGMGWFDALSASPPEVQACAYNQYPVEA